MACIDKIICEVQRITARCNTSNPFDICKSLGIHIHYVTLAPTLNAYYFSHSRIQNIVIHDGEDTTLHKVLCAHELGHALLHTTRSKLQLFREERLYDATELMEYEANLFAAELLISDEDVLSCCNRDSVTMNQLAAELCVPLELLDFKLRLLRHKGYAVSPSYDAKAKFLQAT